VEAWVIEAEGAVAGIALVRRNFLAGDYLELFAVAPAARRKGLGACLLADLERRVFARTKNFFVCVSDFNRGGRRFYERSGYREVGPIPDLLVAGADEILLRKTIGPARAR
jgi:[ribosomal protein S18]-alanine N-acetyltransferase